MDRSEQINLKRLLPAVIALDEHQVITHWSHGAESLFGISREAAVGQAADRLDGWHLDPLTLRSYADLPPGEVRQHFNQIVTRRGVHLTMNSLASASLDAQGRKEVLIRFCLTPRPGQPRCDWLEPSAEDASPDGAAAGPVATAPHRPTARGILARIRSHS